MDLLQGKQTLGRKSAQCVSWRKPKMTTPRPSCTRFIRQFVTCRTPPEIVKRRTESAWAARPLITNVMAKTATINGMAVRGRSVHVMNVHHGDYNAHFRHLAHRWGYWRLDPEPLLAGSRNSLATALSYKFYFFTFLEGSRDPYKSHNGIRYARSGNGL